MAKFIDIISPIYQKLLKDCERRKISINLDIENPTIKITNEQQLLDFYTTELKRAIKNCDTGGKITLSQTNDRISIRYTSGKLLEPDLVEQLRSKGYQVRARFGYDTIISLIF